MLKFRALILQYLRKEVVFSKIIFLKFYLYKKTAAENQKAFGLEISSMFFINKEDPAGLVLKIIDDVIGLLSVVHSEVIHMIVLGEPSSTHAFLVFECHKRKCVLSTSKNT